MKRIALSICIAIAAISLGACEEQSVKNLPDRYRHKWEPKTSERAHDSKAPAHGESGKVPEAAHKG
jgi:hypothetical protein